MENQTNTTSVKIALISMRPKIAHKKENVEKMKAFIKKEKADMYIFGETVITGYRCQDELRDLAEPLNGPSIQALKKIAMEKEVYLIFGIPLKHQKFKGVVQNVAVLIHPSGHVDFYEKWYLPTFGPFVEKLFFDEGEHLPVFQTKYGKIGLLICYDLYFPEIPKAYALQGADIIICLSASPSTTRTYFETLLPARAIETTTFVIYVNIVGTQEDLVFWGGSQAFNPLGKQIIKAPYHEESIISFTIDTSELLLARANRPTLRDNRAQIYLDLYDIARQKKRKSKSK